MDVFQKINAYFTEIASVSDILVNLFFNNVIDIYR